MGLISIRLLDIPRIKFNFGMYERNDHRKDKMFTVRLKLDKNFWGEAGLTIKYLRNRCPIRVALRSMTPQETCSRKKLDVSHLKIFGRAYVRIPKELRTKLDSKSKHHVRLL